MNDREAGVYWDQNADVWTFLARRGCDVYRDLVNTPGFLAMLPDVAGLAGLDLGCGDGHNTRLVAARGARMTAIDISPRFVAHAAEIDEFGVAYAIGSAQELPFRDSSFDFATAFMSLMDMPNPDLALREAARVLKPRGFLQFSILHPCFFPAHRRLLRDSQGREYAVEIGRYFDGEEPRFEEWLFSVAPQELKASLRPFRIPIFHRPLSDWFNMIVDAGLQIERVSEPRVSEEDGARFPSVRDTRVVAYFLHARARKP